MICSDRFYDRVHALKLQKDQQLMDLKENFNSREQQDLAAVDTMINGSIVVRLHVLTVDTTMRMSL